jgi:hypothetical protein
MPGMTHDPSGERRLLLAVLEDAVRTLGMIRRGGVSRRRAALEHSWFLSTDRTHPFAFETICDVLGFDAGAIRARLLGPACPARVTIRRQPRMFRRRGAMPS